MKVLFGLLLSCLVAVQGWKGEITVSGISSGGAFAVQFHVAYSSGVSGAGIIAGAPYWCANGNAVTATTTCMLYPALISISQLVSATRYAYATNSIDSPNNLANAKVYLFSGSKDTIVNPGVVGKLQDYYGEFISSKGNITTQYSIPAEHSFVTNNFGNNCAYLGSPYINNCNFDTAGAMLNFLLGPLKPPVAAIYGNIYSINQAPYLPPLATLYTASMGQKAYVYVPTKCTSSSGNCPIHVAFHGCAQSISMIGLDYVNNTNYNRWAESNNIIILFPQVEPNTLNPQGCWDWGGYTGTGYATQLGWQMITVSNMVDNISSNGISWN